MAQHDQAMARMDHHAMRHDTGMDGMGPQEPRMPVEARAQTLAHLRLVAGLPGFWELRALQRQGGPTMAARGSFFIIATTTAEGALIYDRLEQAVDWADAQDRVGAEIFVGMNPREREARSKAAVAVVTACYVDLDLTDGESQESALAAVTDGDAPLPSVVVNSGYGLHVVYLLRVPSRDKATWARTQKALARRYSALGADPKVAGDESRVLRLVPYPNRKMSPDGVPTSIVYESEYRYELAELARALAPEPPSNCGPTAAIGWQHYPRVAAHPHNVELMSHVSGHAMACPMMHSS